RERKRDREREGGGGARQTGSHWQINAMPYCPLGRTVPKHSSPDALKYRHPYTQTHTHTHTQTYTYNHKHTHFPPSLGTSVTSPSAEQYYHPKPRTPSRHTEGHKPR